MHYDGTIFRPPREAHSILLQVTTGCSHNKCTFCGMYKGIRFAIKDEATIFNDIAFAAACCRNQHRLFLCDGDALIIPQKRLVAILSEINKKLPWVNRIGTYANTRSIRKKSIEELEELKDLGLEIAYMGLETGDDVTLERIQKGADSAEMIEMGRKIRTAGIKLSLTVLLGIAGKKRSFIHATETGRVLSAIDPEYVAVLTLMLTPNTEAYEEFQNKTRSVPEPMELLQELSTMFEATHLSKGQFHANHASNYLPISARLPRDREKIRKFIADALKGSVLLKPEYMRRL
ncbi:MAG: radical SAM protein [Desulfobacterales bacterium]|nr:MAG: radical SAM protein [Desulfobacterales bacterium]